MKSLWASEDANAVPRKLDPFTIESLGNTAAATRIFDTITPTPPVKDKRGRMNKNQKKKLFNIYIYIYINSEIFYENFVPAKRGFSGKKSPKIRNKNI